MKLGASVVLGVLSFSCGAGGVASASYVPWPENCGLVSGALPATVGDPTFGFVLEASPPAVCPFASESEPRATVRVGTSSLAVQPGEPKDRAGCLPALRGSPFVVHAEVSSHCCTASGDFTVVLHPDQGTYLLSGCFDTSSAGPR